MFQDYEDRRLPVRQNQNENPANPNPPREDPPAADGQGGGRGDDQRIPRADGAEPRQDNPLEQLIGNPLFQAMARAPAVNAVGNCRLPAFWRSDPDLWFLQVEAQFNIHQVTSDSTRFNMILTVLDPETISEVSDIIRAPPAQDRYTTLKDAIVARLTDSPDTQLHKLLGTIELGDKKPSQLLLQMRTLAGARASNDILRRLDRGVLLVPREIRRRGRAVQRLARVFTPQGPSGKLGVLTLHSAPAVSITIERRLYVTDRTHKIRFPHRLWLGPLDLAAYSRSKPLQRKTLELQAANGTTIATYGQHSLTLNLGLRRPFEWAFTIARVDVAIIGADLLSHFGLLIDLRKPPPLGQPDELVHIVPGRPGPPGTHDQCSCDRCPSRSLRRRVRRHTREFASDRARPGEMATIVDFPVQHRIVTTSGQPVFARPRRLAGDRLAAAKAEFKKLLDRGIIRPSSSQWASPLHLVPKPGNTWRITGDYRLLNARTQPDRHPLPIIEDLLQESVGKVFSVVDLYKAFTRSRSQKKTSRRRPSRHLSASSSL
ncbi:unnamed protein product [Trichogramma brassicae]|uniref:DUF7041 domain-containing protein n=1 Tax=Trichogramma brassicae TaxID=86971 RepID=A0A6H5I5C5_9HYME|nr:unnamed protein product [Trichogramma brassicae]